MQSIALKKTNASMGKVSSSGRGARVNEIAALKKGFRILIVDDESGIRECLSWVLDSMGFEVAVAGSGFEALGMFKRGSFELVMTDLNMPGMDGWRLSRKIKEKSPITKIVLLTGEAAADVNEKLPESCVDSVLFKPFKIEGVKSAILKIRDNVQDKPSTNFHA